MGINITNPKPAAMKHMTMNASASSELSMLPLSLVMPGDYAVSYERGYIAKERATKQTSNQRPYVIWPPSEFELWDTAGRENQRTSYRPIVHVGEFRPRQFCIVHRNLQRRDSYQAEKRNASGAN